MRGVCYGDRNGFYGGCDGFYGGRDTSADSETANPNTFDNYTRRNNIYSNDIPSGMSQKLNNSYFIYNQPSLGRLPDGDPVDTLHVNATISLASVPSLSSSLGSVLDSMAITPVRASPTVVTIDPMALMLLIGFSSLVLATIMHFVKVVMNIGTWAGPSPSPRPCSISSTTSRASPRSSSARRPTSSPTTSSLRWSTCRTMSNGSHATHEFDASATPVANFLVGNGMANASACASTRAT